MISEFVRYLKHNALQLQWKDENDMDKTSCFFRKIISKIYLFINHIYLAKPTDYQEKFLSSLCSSKARR